MWRALATPAELALGATLMKAATRAIFDQDRVHPAAAEKLGGYQAELIERVRGLVSQHDVVVVGMTMNPFPGRARKLLEQQRVAYEYLGLGSYFSQWRVRLGLKMWTGWPTFPMIFVKRTFIGGYSELRGLVQSGELVRMLSAS
jgi:glutaredoxin-related protein